jgi:signal transduction histidine kinase
VRVSRHGLVDAGLVLLMLVVGLGGTGPAGFNQPAATEPDATAYALVVVAALALAARRRWPVATLAVVAAAASTYLVLGYPFGPILFSFVIAVYTVANRLPLGPAAVAAAVAYLVIALHTVVPGGAVDALPGLAFAAAWVAVPFAVGVARAAGARSRADRARQIADDERLRVAQEVHDVVGHGLAAINMQAEIALHLLARKPEQAEAALTAISRTSKDALDELRSTLAVLRHGEDRAPAPGLGQLPALRDRLAAAGLPVTLTLPAEGAGEGLPAATDLAAYRVVQESLTNVLRHAGAATASVVVIRGPSALEVSVTDTGRGGAVPESGAGTGIAGMRERVTALGGTFAAGPRAGGGFAVRASLPLRTAASSSPSSSPSSPSEELS